MDRLQRLLVVLGNVWSPSSHPFFHRIAAGPHTDRLGVYIDFWLRLIGVHEVRSVVVDNAWNQDHAQSEASLAAGKQSVERIVRGFW